MAVNTSNKFNKSEDDITFICNYASKFKLLTREEEYELLKQTRSEDPKLRKAAYDELVVRNLRLVIKKATEFKDRGLPLGDLVQEGVTGLIRSIEKFDFEKKVKLSTYASIWIEQKVRRALENKSRLVKIPLNRLAQITALKKAYRKFVEDNPESSNPSSEEIAAILNISQEDAEELGRLQYSHTSLDDTAGEDDRLSMISYLVDNAIGPEEKVEAFSDKTYVDNLVNLLSYEDANFIKLKYGFMDNRVRTHKEMAMLLKCTIKEIKEKEEKILSVLRELADYEDVNYMRD